MGSNFAVAPGNANTVTGINAVFTYSLYWPDDAPWSASAVFRVISDDGSHQHDFAKGDGTPSGPCVAFVVSDALPGVRYRGLLVDGDITLSLFASVDLCALQHPADPCCYLPFPNPSDQQTGAPEGDPTSAAAPAATDAPSTDASWSSDPSSSTDASTAGDSSDVDPTAVANAAGPPPGSPPSGMEFG